MAWMPAAQAAATLGVSERTVWRRIKSHAIESRSENGRTLVVVNDPPSITEEGHELSRVAPAQLSTQLDAESASDVLGTLSDLRDSLHMDINRARRTGRWAIVIAAALAVALGAGIWYHSTQIADLQQSHAAVLATLSLEHHQALAERQAESTRAGGLSQALSEEVESLRNIGSDQRARLAAAQAAQDVLQRSVDERLAQLSTAVTDDRQLAAQRDQEIAGLRKTVAELRERLHDEKARYQVMRKQSDRVTEAIRRSAARSIGLAEGLKLNLVHQRAVTSRLQSALEERLFAANVHPGTGEDFDMRRAIWTSMIDRPPRPAGGAGATAPPLGDEESPAAWESVMQAWIQAWLPDSPDTVSPGKLASAE